MDFKTGKTVRAPRGVIKKLVKHYKNYSVIAAEIGCSGQALSKLASGARENCREPLRDALVALLRDAEGKSLNKPKAPPKVKAVNPLKGGRRVEIPTESIGVLVEHYGTLKAASSSIGAHHSSFGNAQSRGYMGSKMRDAIFAKVEEIKKPAPEPERPAPEPERPAPYEIGQAPELPGSRLQQALNGNGGHRKRALTPLSQRLAALAVEASGDGERLERIEVKIDALGEILERLLTAWEG